MKNGDAEDVKELERENVEWVDSSEPEYDSVAGSCENCK
jgi:hypothetical protein